MAERYQLDGQEISLNVNDTLGNGGQAVVVKYNDQAIKIWKTTEPDQVKKVEFMLRNKPHLPNNFIVPQSRLTKNGRDLCGYGMKLLPKNFREAGVLFNRVLRRDLKINTPTLVAILSSAYKDIALIHQQQIVVGDVSGRNIAFVAGRNGIETFSFDTDSWQMGGYRCPVWTDLFLCPDLYKEVSTGKISFTESSDWYSFNTILFWSLFNVNPYSQIHPKYTEFHDRASKGVWLFTSGVNYPKLCPHPETIDDNLLHLFDEVFAKHHYLAPKLDDLKNFQSSLIECNSCGSFYPNSRKACPVCTHKTPAIDFRPVYYFEAMIKSIGRIIFAKMQGTTLYAISEEKTGLFLWIRPQTSTAVKVPINFDPEGKVIRFDIVGNDYLAINIEDSDIVYLTPISAPGSSWIPLNTSIYLGNRLAAFRGTSQGLLKLSGSDLTISRLVNDSVLSDSLPISIAPNQTWFWADGEGKLVLTLSRFFAEYQFQLISNGKRYEVQVPPLKNSDSLQDLCVHFSRDSILLRRTVNRGGRLIVLSNVINNFGQITYDRILPLSGYPNNNLHTLAFNDHKVFWPTDQGIVIENLENGNFDTIPNTDRIVCSSDKIDHLGGEKHFLITSDYQVSYLNLTHS
ncbi:MAG TPA: hypothetical protein PLI45_04455 [Candidatus Woesebacteria bacterium]|nr:hypothetical protein [Candidatus Woesebacteria bacterium]